MKVSEATIKFRLFICLMGFVGGFVVLTLRVWQLHVTSDVRVSNLKDKQVQYSAKLTLKRGNIRDVHGRELAMSARAPSVFVDPSVIEPTDLKKVGRLLNLSERELEQKIEKGSRKFAWIKRYADGVPEKALEKIDGVYLTYEWKRYYPEKELAAQVIGMVNSEGQGVDGIESMYNEYLKTHDINIRSEKDAKGRAIFSSGSDVSDGQEGADIYLTLDSNIQYITERELKAAAIKSRSRSAMAVVMDPHTGKILAMASYPPVNLNKLDDYDSSLWKNQALVDIFEPGSTFKVFTLAAALENNLLSSKTVYDCREGSLKFGRKVIRNIIKKDALTAKDILKYSNNVGTARIGLAIGQTRMDEAIRRLGFGEKTGVHFPLESRGLVSSRKTWKDIDLANISFGQGVGVTALQMTTALSVIANGGYEVQPKLVEKALLSDGTEKSFVAIDLEPRRVLKKETVHVLTDWMESVVEEDGTGTKARVEGFKVAGKTGTAQVIEDESGKYSAKLVNSSFMGFVPSDNPKLAALFVFREPKDSDHGGTLAGPVFKNVMSESLAYLGVEPQKEFVEPVVAENKIKNPKTKIMQGEIHAGLPDLRGLTMREVMNRARELSFDIKMFGSGVVVKQELQPNSKKMNVFFEKPRRMMKKNVGHEAGRRF